MFELRQLRQIIYENTRSDILNWHLHRGPDADTISNGLRDFNVGKMGARGTRNSGLIADDALVEMRELLKLFGIVVLVDRV